MIETQSTGCSKPCFVPVFGLTLDFKERALRLADGQEFLVIRRIDRSPTIEQLLLEADIRSPGFNYVVFQSMPIGAEIELRHLPGSTRTPRPDLALVLVDLLHVRTGSLGATPVTCNRSLTDIGSYPRDAVHFDVLRADTLFPDPIGEGKIGLDDIGWADDQFSAFVRLTPQQKFQIAFDALTTSHHPRYLEPRLLTLWSGIEALFGIANELSFRVSFLSATYLEGRGARGLLLFNQIKENYGVRSKIAHGSRVARQSLSTAISFAHALLRRLLIKTLESRAVPSESSILFGDENDEQGAGNQSD